MAQDLTTAVEGSNKGELFTSFDVDAFEVPHGRDEIWRFTPLRGCAACTTAPHPPPAPRRST